MTYIFSLNVISILVSNKLVILPTNMEEISFQIVILMCLGNILTRFLKLFWWYLIIIFEKCIVGINDKYFKETIKTIFISNLKTLLASIKILFKKLLHLFLLITITTYYNTKPIYTVCPKGNYKIDVKNKFRQNLWNMSTDLY